MTVYSWFDIQTQARQLRRECAYRSTILSAQESNDWTTIENVSGSDDTRMTITCWGNCKSTTPVILKTICVSNVQSKPLTISRKCSQGKLWQVMPASSRGAPAWRLTRRWHMRLQGRGNYGGKTERGQTVWPRLWCQVTGWWSNLWEARLCLHKKGTTKPRPQVSSQ